MKTTTMTLLAIMLGFSGLANAQLTDNLDSTNIGLGAVNVEAVGSIATIRVGSPMNFGTVNVGAAAVDRTITFRNTGNEPMFLANGVTNQPAGVSLVSNTCNNVAVQAECTMTFRMATNAVRNLNQVVNTQGAGTNVGFTIRGIVQNPPPPPPPPPFSRTYWNCGPAPLDQAYIDQMYNVWRTCATNGGPVWGNPPVYTTKPIYVSPYGLNRYCPPGTYPSGYFPPIFDLGGAYVHPFATYRQKEGCYR